MKCLEVEIIVIRAIVCIISLFGCVWHLADISNIYFSYETNVNVDFEREIMVQVPGVTICINSSLTAREDYFKLKYPNLAPNFTMFENSKHYFLGKLLKGLTLDEQLNEATADYSQVFNSCLIMKPVAFESVEPRDYIECDKITLVRQYITYSKKCFSIASQLAKEDPRRYIVDHDTVLRDNGFPLFQIKLNNQYLDQPVIFIHSRKTPFLGFMGGQINGIHINNTKYSSYTLRYESTISHLLPPPYKTMCRDYSKIGYQTLSHCIVSCKANYFINEFNGWHPDIPANDEYNLNVHYSRMELKENKTLDKLIAEKCLQICTEMEDCDSEYYSISTIGQFERSVHSPQYDLFHSIYIYLPTGRNARYIHSPRLHLIEYICYFASVFSLWFGFSIIAIAKALIKAYQYYTARKAQLPDPTSNSYEIQAKEPYSL